MVTRTISWPELVWTIVTFFGFIFCAKLAVSAVFDLVSLRARSINSIREYAAITTTIAFMSWVVCQSLFVFAGIATMVAPNKSGITITSLVLTGLFLAGSGALSWAAYTVDRRRRALITKIMEIEDTDEKSN